VSSCIVLIAPSELLSDLASRASDENGEVLTFTDADALRALETITKRRPGVVALERLFAATPRGAALINRIKADPALTGSEIRIVAHDTDYARVSPRRPANSGVTAAVAEPVATPSAPLDQRGTRRAPRFRIARNADLLVDGNQAALIDLSTLGAQVISATVLKPNQRVRVALFDDEGTVRLIASVAWASFEIPVKSGPRYRAGLEFIDADPAGIDAYCRRHGA
jgi:hypothetical protein